METRLPLESPADSFSSETGHRTITPADLILFGGATGDYARMHFDHDLAAAEPGSPPPIAPGLLSAAWALGAIARSAPERLALGDPDAWVAGYTIRFERSMRVGDRFSLRHREAAGAAVDGLSPVPGRDTEFEVRNQRGERTCRGAVSVRSRGEAVRPPTMSRPTAPSARADRDLSRPLYADDLIEFGPRGESHGRTVTEADIVGFTNLTAERNPIYLNRVFAGQGRFGDRIAPPIWTFCLGFGDFLQSLLAAPLPSTGLAGHLGDSFRGFTPVRVGDTLRTRHRPVRCTSSRGRPEMSVVHFALQLLNQDDELVQDGEVAMWIPSRGSRDRG